MNDLNHIEQSMDKFFEWMVHGSSIRRSLCGYTLIIALLLVFPKNGRVDMAIRLANWMVPLSFLVFGEVLLDVTSWMGGRLLSRWQTSDETGDKNE